MSQLRWHPLQEEWVAVASHRQVRPISLGKAKAGVKQPSCPFCPGGAEGLNAPYEFAVFENKFPSFNRNSDAPSLGKPGDLYRAGPGRGICEVVLYSPRHDSTLAEESRENIGKLVEVWRDRYIELGKLPFIKYVYEFENKGAVIGVTLQHPHGQIYAFPYIPPRVKSELDAERRYMAKHRRCLLCDMARREKSSGARVVELTDKFIAYVPYFARYPYEIHISSRRHVGSLAGMTRAERWDLSGILKTVLMKYDSLFGFSFPYIMLMHQEPTDGRKYPHHHFHIEFFPPHRSADKIKYLAGCEAGAGTFINDTIPEEKAAELRRCRPSTVRLER